MAKPEDIQAPKKMKPKILARHVQTVVEALASPQRAEVSQRFFKTGKGQYGEGDLFIGVTVPQIRKVAKKFHEISLAENTKLVRSKWHELRLLGLIIWTNQYQKADPKKQKIIFQNFMKNKKWVNNWDLVDVTVPLIVGHYLFHTKNKKLIFQLVESKILWDRRIAVLSTFYFIRQNQFSEILALCEILLKDQEDLMHKACGWMLREVGKRNKTILVRFLNKNASQMPRTMLRYAIEKFPQVEKNRFMKRG